MHVDDPLDQEGTARVFDLCRQLDLREVVSVDFQSGFCFSHVLVNISSEFSNHLWVTNLKLVGEDHGLADLSAMRDQPLFEDLSDRLIRRVGSSLFDLSALFGNDSLVLFLRLSSASLHLVQLNQRSRLSRLEGTDFDSGVEGSVCHALQAISRATNRLLLLLLEELRLFLAGSNGLNGLEEAMGGVQGAYGLLSDSVRPVRHDVLLRDLLWSRKEEKR